MTEPARLWLVELPCSADAARQQRDEARAMAGRVGASPRFVRHATQGWSDTDAPGSDDVIAAIRASADVVFTAAGASAPLSDVRPLLCGRARPEVVLPRVADEAVYGDSGQVSWTMDTGVAADLLSTATDGATAIQSLLAPDRRLTWDTAGNATPTAGQAADGTVVAVVPYFRCAPWIDACLYTLSNQTRPPDRIVVACDGDDRPPDAILDEWPHVTFASSRQNVGPYALVQAVVDRTPSTWVMIQDADDWSSADRLARQLAAARLGAELIGTADLRIEDGSPRLAPAAYPASASHAARRTYGHIFLYGSSLISRDLLQRLGGFSTGLRFGADTEFVRRASLAARVVSLEAACYYRRLRATSLTGDARTGIGSEARNAVIASIMRRARRNERRLRWRLPPRVGPLAPRGPVDLRIFHGPHAW